LLSKKKIISFFGKQVSNLNFHSTFFETCQHSAKISPWLARQDFKKGTLKISIEANQKQFKIIIRFKLQSKRFDFFIKMFQKEYILPRVILKLFLCHSVSYTNFKMKKTKKKCFGLDF
jgi:hypothetical protein